MHSQQSLEILIMYPFRPHSHVFPQYVEGNMRKYDTSSGICQCQGGVQDCCSATNLVYFTLTYRPEVQNLPGNIKTVKKWTKEAKEALQDGIEDIDWHMLCQSSEEENGGLRHCIADYINSCLENESKWGQKCKKSAQARVWPNGISPRVLKTCLNQLCGVLQHLFSRSVRLQKVSKI